ncbi:SMP-30/gluconolactonase/LRE family protein [Candidatus Colwellia aromaticivorans]|uniref:SMP-30/gluconolactonase/LRE family protein n=1 Tax=Candidatus Colwellia aromaticivorans TaxID=2267621 RepID=UPI000DF48D88|nr:SMP-30/gluconolactonase/LRE family protein [Candidatus Colwellia aromaticivorans]
MNKVTCIWDAKAQLGEGAVWHEGEQALFWVDIINSKLHRYKVDKQRIEVHKTWAFSNNISSVVPCAEGGLLATFRDGVAHINLKNSQVIPLCELEKELVDNRFNDGCADTRGNYWFGSMDDKQTDASGAFYRFNAHSNDNADNDTDTNKQVEKLTQLGEICITNGPTFSQDGHWLYFTDTMAGKIFRARLGDDGAIGKKELHIHFTQDQGHPDGMCCDTQGHLWVCHWGGARVSRFDSKGNLVSAIKLPVPNVTKCCFGGPNLNTLYITTAATGLSEAQLQETPLAGGLFAIELEQQGFVYPDVSMKTSEAKQAKQGKESKEIQQ